MKNKVKDAVAARPGSMLKKDTRAVRGTINNQMTPAPQLANDESAAARAACRMRCWPEPSVGSPGCPDESDPCWKIAPRNAKSVAVARGESDSLTRDYNCLNG